jgi:hypothetical protein
MRGKRLAFIYTQKKDISDFYNLENGLINSFEWLNKNYEYELFAFSDNLNLLRKNKYNVVLRDTVKSMDFALNKVFNPTHVFFVGDTNFDFSNIKINKNVPKFLIHKGEYHHDSYINYFKNVIVETEKDAIYKNSIVKNSINFQIFKNENCNKMFDVCMFHNDLNLDLNGLKVISDKIANTFNLDLKNTKNLNHVFNYSKYTLLTGKEQDAYELALASILCNSQVITVGKNKISDNLPVSVLNSSLKEFIEKDDYNKNNDLDFRKYLAINYAQVIMGCIE